MILFIITYAIGIILNCVIFQYLVYIFKVNDTITDTLHDDFILLISNSIFSFTIVILCSWISICILIYLTILKKYDL